MPRYRLNIQAHPDEYSKVCYGDTDSVFMIIKTKSFREFTELSKQICVQDSKQKIYFDKLKTDVIRESFETGKVLAEEISEILFKNPIKLEFEKVYYPLVLFSKKRYIGNYYGKSPYSIDFVENKGIVLKRRDNPNIVKKLYKEFIDPILVHGRPGIEEAVKHLKKEIIKILENKNDISDLVVTKSLSKSYGKERCNYCEKSATRKRHHYFCTECSEKYQEVVSGQSERCFSCPKKATKKAMAFYCKKHSEGIPDCQVITNVYSTENSPHIALCKKIAKRDPGASPVVGDRINYVFIEDENPKSKLFEKAEDPQYVLDNNLKIDVNYYINNQIKKPISEILQFLIDNHETFFDDILENYTESKKKQTFITSHFKYIGDPSKVL